MHARLLRQTILDYADHWSHWTHQDPNALKHERDTVARFLRLAESGDACFHNNHLPGHITGSALVVTPTFDQVLLTLHRKLQKWLQLGGHSDGHPYTHEVALREAHEESGLTDLNPIFFEPQGRVDHPLPFDLDVHLIPERPNMPAHYHFDVRYVIIAKDPKPIVISEESLDLQWFTIQEARAVSNEPSMLRQFHKLSLLRESGKIQPRSLASITASGTDQPIY